MEVCVLALSFVVSNEFFCNLITIDQGGAVNWICVMITDASISYVPSDVLPKFLELKVILL